MLTKVQHFFLEKQKQRRLQTLISIPENPKLTLCIAHNKELCEVQPFLDLLKLFDYYLLQGHHLQQNTNATIISFKTTIYETCKTLSKIHKNLIDRDVKQVSFVARIARAHTSSYLFFNDKEDQSYTTFDQASLDQLVNWMRKIIVYFDAHKTSQDNFDEAFCSVTYQNLDVLYDFFYCLLCHIVNIRCDKHKRICIFLQEDI